MRFVVDRVQWKAIDEKYPDFAQVFTNLQLGLVEDGVVPFKNNAIKYSTWVFLLTIYNLPPWLLTKKFFISLAVLIPGPTATKLENQNVFLAPVVRDLLKLWRSIPTIDILKPEDERVFTLRGMLIWTVNNFPAYGLLSSQQVHGYKGCPLCGPETCAEHAWLLHKMVYLSAKRSLDTEHPFQRARTLFNNHLEWQMAPERSTGEEIFQWSIQREENSSDDPMRLHGIKRRSIFFDLPYWKVHFSNSQVHQICVCMFIILIKV